MSRPDDLKAAAQAFLTEDKVLAAGVFGVPDNYLTITAFGVAGSAAADSLGVGSPVLDGAVAGAAVHAAREANAAAQGLTPRLLLAVTPTMIHVLDWENGRVHRELLSFTRATTNVEVSKFGASRRMSMRDTSTGVTLEVTGSTGFLSSEAAADKIVLEILYGH